MKCTLCEDGGWVCEDHPEYGNVTTPAPGGAGTLNNDVERAHCNLTGFTEWPHENQTLAKFRGYHFFGFSSHNFLASQRGKE